MTLYLSFPPSISVGREIQFSNRFTLGEQM
jgi:hypothetical protein